MSLAAEQSNLPLAHDLSMRSRPDIALYLSPTQPSPGQTLRATVELRSSSETPYDAIDIVFIGRESRFKYTASTGKSTVRKYHRRVSIQLGHQFPGGVLGVGTFKHIVDFNLPADLAPTFGSQYSSIAYEMSVRVHIPWWPDRQETFTIPVRIAPRPAPALSPIAHTTAQGDQRGDDPIIELSLESNVLSPGGNLNGAIAFTGLGDRRLRHVELVLSQIETPLVESKVGSAEVERRTWKILEKTPEEGVGIPFRLAIPPEVVPNFQSAFLRIDYALEVVGVVAFGTDLKLRVPVVVEQHKNKPKRSAELPLVGKVRHLSVWRAAVDAIKAAKLHVVEFDPERASMVLDMYGIRVQVIEEHREKFGPCLVAELNYPSLGLDVRLCERRWTDFGSKIPEMDRALAKRFTAQAREPRQVTQLLGASLQKVLNVFEEAALDDETAVVVQKGGVYRASGLERFVSLVQALALFLTRARKKIPAPAELAKYLAGYQQFAMERGATLCVGDLSLSDIHCGGMNLSLTHVFEGALPRESLLLVALTPAQLEKGLPAGYLESLRVATGYEGVAVDESVGIRLPLVEDPAMHLQTMDTLAACVSMLDASTKLGPYR